MGEQAINLLTKELSAKKNPCQLVSLNLSSTFLTPRQVLQLRDALKVNRTLTKLDLSSNGFDSQCGLYVVQALEFNISLTYINLARNELMDDPFIDQMIQILSNSGTQKSFVLYELDLSGNPFSTDGIQKLLTAIRENTI
jgi:Ran GTPase-activating protein (RanGAP) involved in mRNA processing and transport